MQLTVPLAVLTVQLASLPFADVPSTGSNRARHGYVIFPSPTTSSETRLIETVFL